jgi:hypothetical protein
MTDDQAAAPKRTAMQVALDAERAAQKALGEAENLAALLADGDTAADMGAARSPLAVEVGELREGVESVRGNLAHLADQVSKMPDAPAALRELVKDFSAVRGLIPGNLLAGQGGALATQQQVAEAVDSVLAIDKRLRDVEEWQAAELDEDNAGSGDAMAERLAEVEAQLRELRAHPSTHVTGRPAAPHVLGLIAQLQKRVFEIGKGREFRAENQRGDTTQRYSFRGVDDAQDAIGSAQREIGLIGPAVTVVDKTVSTVEVNKGSYTQVWTTVSVTCRYTFQSPVDGSEWSTEGCGMGRDLGDKAESKALAGAFKYALFHGLNIPVRGVFIDAETADPRIERDHEQGGRTYGSGQSPIEQAAGEAFEQAMRNPTPETIARSTELNAQAQQVHDNRTPEQLTVDALAAIRRAGTLGDAVKVWNYAAQAGCLSMFVENAQLGQHMLAAIRLLPGGNAVQLPGMEHFR